MSTLASAGEPGELIRYRAEGETVPSRVTEAVRVTRGDLVHSGQMVGRETPKGGGGVGSLLLQIRDFCRVHGATPESLVRVNFYLGDEPKETRDSLEAAIDRMWPEETRPTITMIASRLPGRASVAADVVLAVPVVVEGAEKLFAAVAPADRDLLYVSGRAARSGSIYEATAETMRQLKAVLAEMGSEPSNVLQVKTFLQPMDEWQAARTAIEEAFGDTKAPPIVFVEWSSSLPTEIELIALAPPGARKETRAGEGVSYFTPEGDKASPVFSRVARVHGPELIYTRSVLAYPEGNDTEAIVRRSFEELTVLQERAGSDLHHLAKATYYVSDDDLSKALNAVRPEFYDPLRPPAASKVAVSVLGVPGGAGLMMDFIGVPAGSSSPSAR